ncbi:pentatricopeptide repeat-containing protein At2g17033 [Nymphaea colorata]|nr:pentatricopeptide repeat-containing protein At2g17033 [Nymphaea colorata]
MATAPLLFGRPALTTLRPPPCTSAPSSISAWSKREDGAVTGFPLCALSKSGGRLLSTLERTRGDPVATARLVRRLVSSSSRPLLLSTLDHILVSDSHWEFALPLYVRLLETPWYRWNPKTVARLAALLEKHGLSTESRSLISDGAVRLKGMKGSSGSAEFYCDLVEFYSKNGLQQQVFDLISEMASQSSSMSRCYSVIVNALARLDLPDQAEEKLEEMEASGFGPSAFDFRSVVLAYGRAGRFSEMQCVVDRMQKKLGFSALDTVCSNMILTSLGDHGKHATMIEWIKKMRHLGIGFSIRTYNSVSNSCPRLSSILKAEPIPLSVNGLFRRLRSSEDCEDEMLLIGEIVSAIGLLPETVGWSSSEWRLDLHGFHICAAYLNLLQWLEEMRLRIDDGGARPPYEVSIVCGSGKHSTVRGESPVRSLVSGMMFRTRSPLKIDRLNGGRFIAKGKAVKEWFSAATMINDAGD